MTSKKLGRPKHKKPESRNKGKTGERELAAMLRDRGFKCRRGQQAVGRAKDPALGRDDVIGLPGIHIECKRVERLNVHDAMDQSVADAKADLTVPVVMHRRNRRPWLVTMRLDDWCDMYRRAAPDDVIR